MSEKTRYIQDVLIVSVATLIGKLRGVIVLVVISKVMGLENYGLWIQASLTAALFSAIAECNLHNSLIRFAAGETGRERIGTVFWTNFTLVALLGTGALTVLVAASGPVSRIAFGNPGHESLLLVIAPLVLFQALNSLTNAFFRAVHSTNLFAIYFSLMAMMDLTAIAFAAVLSPEDPGVVLAGYLVAQVLILIVMVIHIVRGYGLHAPVARDMKTFLLFAAPTLPSIFSEWIFNQSDRFFIANYSGLAAVGVYNAAYVLGQFVMTPVQPINKVLLPTLIRYWEKGDLSQVRLYISATLKYYFVIGIAAVFGLTALARPLLTLLATPDAAGPGSSILPIIALGVLGYGMSYILMLLFYASRKTHMIGLILLGAGICNVTLNIFVIPRWGIVGAAITSLSSYLIVLVGCLWGTHEMLPRPLGLRFIGTCTVLASPLLLLSLLPAMDWIWLLVIAALAGGAYLALVFLSPVIPHHEKRFFTRLVLRREQGSS